MKLIDSHAHIDYPDFDSDRSDLLTRASDAGVLSILNIVMGPKRETLENACSLADNVPNLYLAMGVHPHDADQMADDFLDLLREFSAHPKFRAVGEIGLDYYYENSKKENQLTCFRKQIEVALDLGRPISVHSREAFEDTYRLAKEARVFEKVGGVLHCFTGQPDEAKKFMELGAYISFSGIVSFPKAANVHEAAKVVPLDRMLIETDAPFLAPVPHRGKRNEPAHVVHVAQAIGQIKNVAIEKVAEATTRNTQTLFQLRSM